MDAVSPAGAIGVSQFMPATACKGLGIDPWNPKESIEAQAKYVLWQRSGWTPPDFGGRTGEDIKGLGLGGYNWGRGSMYKSAAFKRVDDIGRGNSGIYRKRRKDIFLASS